MKQLPLRPIREYTERHPIAREELLALARVIAKEDPTLLDALRYA